MAKGPVAAAGEALAKFERENPGVIVTRATVLLPGGAGSVKLWRERGRIVCAEAHLLTEEDGEQYTSEYLNDR